MLGGFWRCLSINLWNQPYVEKVSSTFSPVVKSSYVWVTCVGFEQTWESPKLDLILGSSQSRDQMHRISRKLLRTRTSCTTYYAYYHNFILNHWCFGGEFYVHYLFIHFIYLSYHFLGTLEPLVLWSLFYLAFFWFISKFNVLFVTHWSCFLYFSLHLRSPDVLHLLTCVLPAPAFPWCAPPVYFAQCLWDCLLFLFPEIK